MRQKMDLGTKFEGNRIIDPINCVFPKFTGQPPSGREYSTKSKLRITNVKGAFAWLGFWFSAF